MKKIIFCLGIAAAASLTFSCKKYEDGPGISFRSSDARLEGTWVLDQYLRNGQDETSQLLISNYMESYIEGGVYKRSYTEPDGGSFDEIGSWEFQNDKEQIKIDGISSIELTANTSTVTTSSIDILRLKKKELWYKFENGGDVHEFRMVR